MTAVPFVWKIRDSKTGLYWDGYNNECSHPIGTRFVRSSVVHETILRIHALKKEGKIRGEPLDWEVVYVELVEEDRHVSSMGEAIRDHLALKATRDVMLEMGCPYMARDTATFAFHLMYERRNYEWVAIGVKSDTKSWSGLKRLLKKYDISEDRLSRKSDGVYLLRDPTIVMMLRSNDFFQVVLGTDEIKERVERKLDAEASFIAIVNEALAVSQ